ncbi:MAG: TonB-dependent receptor [Chloroflexota bacterium]|nr:TonB-dependent receptor [Chloroflexota bacterium]
MGSHKTRQLVLLGLWALGAQSVLAQETESSQMPESEPIEEQALPVEATEWAASEARPVEEIVVTGSRIRRDEFSSASPITVINSETSALAGLLDTADILQGSTVATGQQIDDSFSGFVTDGGPGARSVSLRGFGAQRTLVLVNGRRWGPSGVRGATNSVDLTAIPSSVVARYEILKDGASSIYGADAIAGVVNVITKQRFEGFQVNIEGLFPHSDGGEERGIDATWGRVGDTWSFSVSGSYATNDELRREQRDWAACDERPRVTDQDGDGRIDNAHPETGEPLCFGFIYGFAVSPFGWVRYEPSLATLDPANPYFDPSGPNAYGIPHYTTIPVNGLDPFNGEPLYDNEGEFYRDERDPSVAQIVPEYEIYSLTSFGDKDFEIGGRSVNAYYEFYYNHRTFESNGGYRQFFPAVPASNPTNPFGAYGPLAAFGGFGALPVLPSYELLDPVTTVKIDRINLFAGLSGDFSARWGYEAYFGYSWSDGSYEAQQLLDDRVRASLNSTLDANGNLVCAEPSIAGCVPANLFAEDALLRGRLPADVLNFLRKDTRGETTYKSLQFAAHVTGTLFEMPNEEAVGAVLGFEYRNEDIRDVPDPDAQNNNFWGFTTAGITSGDDTVVELFAEVEVPLLVDMPLAEELIVNVSGRYTDYDSYGSDTTYRAAVDWQLIPWLRLRGTRGTSFRAPDLYEQFLADQTGFVSGQFDPCLNYGDQYEPGDVVYDNCASQGLPPDFGTAGAPSIRNVIGGNRDLEAETSKSWTGGVVIQPEALGLSVAFSWFEIDLKNTVADPSTGYILGTCYSSQGLSNAWCDRVSPRDERGNLTDVDASLVNIGRSISRGYDIDFVYEKEFSTFDLTLDGTLTRLMEQSTQLFDERWNNVNNWGYPKWAGEFDVRVDYRDWTYFWRVNYIGNTSEDAVFDPGTTNADRKVRTPKTWLHNVSARLRKADWEVIASVRNLFNKKPPLVGDNVPRDATSRVFNTLPGVGYSLLGRTYVLQISRSF